MRALRAGALLAQLVEHFIRNEGVRCSNQIDGTSFQENRSVSQSGPNQPKSSAIRSEVFPVDSRVLAHPARPLVSLRALPRVPAPGASFPYRRHVVEANLKSSFPEWDDATREQRDPRLLPRLRRRVRRGRALAAPLAARSSRAA